jgi:hypothetical protein
MLRHAVAPSPTTVDLRSFATFRAAPRSQLSVKVDRTESRLVAQEPHRRRTGQQVRDALVGCLLVLDAGAEPDRSKRPV